MVLKKSVLTIFAFLFLILISFNVSSQSSPIKQVNHFGTFCDLAMCENDIRGGYLDVLNPNTCEYDLVQCPSKKAISGGTSPRLTRGVDCYHDNDCPVLGCVGVGYRTMEVMDVSCEPEHPVDSFKRKWFLEYLDYDYPGICAYQLGSSVNYCTNSKPACVMDTDCPSLSCSNSFMDGYVNKSTGKWISDPPKQATGICSSGECTYNPDRDCSRKVECTKQTFTRDCGGPAGDFWYGIFKLPACASDPSVYPGKCFVPGAPLGVTVSPRAKGYCVLDSRVCPSECSDGKDNDGDGKTDYPNDLQCQGKFYGIESGIYTTAMIPGTPMIPPGAVVPGAIPGTSGSSCQVVTNNPNVDLSDYEPNKEVDNNPAGGPWEFNYAGPSSVSVSSASQINPDNNIVYLRPSLWDVQAQSFWTKPREAIVPSCEGDKLLYPVDIVVAHLGGYNDFKRGTKNFKFLTLSRYCALNQNDADCKDTCSADNKIGVHMDYLKRIEAICLQGQKPDLSLEPGTGPTLQDGCGAYWLLTDVTKDPVDFLKNRDSVYGYNCDRRYPGFRGICTSSGITPQHFKQLSSIPIPNDLKLLDPKSFSIVGTFGYGYPFMVFSYKCENTGIPSTIQIPPGTRPSGYCCKVNSLTCAPQCPENYVMSPATGECVHKLLITGKAISSVTDASVVGFDCRIPNPSPETVLRFKDNMNMFAQYVGTENMQSFMNAISVSPDGAINIDYNDAVIGLDSAKATEKVAEAVRNAERMNIFASLNWLRILSFYPSVGMPPTMEVVQWTFTVPDYANTVYGIITDALTASPFKITTEFAKKSFTINTFYETTSDDDKNFFDVTCGNDGSTTFTYTSFSSGNLVVTNKYGQTVATGEASFRSDLSITLLSDAIPSGEFFVTFTGDNDKTDTSSHKTPCSGVTITSNDPQEPPTDPPSDPPDITGVNVIYGLTEPTEGPTFGGVVGAYISLAPTTDGAVTVTLNNGDGETSTYTTSSAIAGAIINYMRSDATNDWSPATLAVASDLIGTALAQTTDSPTTDVNKLMATGKKSDLELGTGFITERLSEASFSVIVNAQGVSPKNPAAISFELADDPSTSFNVMMTQPSQQFSFSSQRIAEMYGGDSFELSATRYQEPKPNFVSQFFSFIQDLIMRYTFPKTLQAIGRQAEQTAAPQQYLQGYYQGNPMQASQSQPQY